MILIDYNGIAIGNVITQGIDVDENHGDAEHEEQSRSGQSASQGQLGSFSRLNLVLHGSSPLPVPTFS